MSDGTPEWQNAFFMAVTSLNVVVSWPMWMIRKFCAA